MQTIDQVIIHLTPDELEQAKRDGKAMFDNKKGNGNLAAPVGKRSPLYYDILGMAGEIAVYRYLGLEWKFELHDLRDKGDLNRGGYCFDIKTVPVRGNLINAYLEIPVRHTENTAKDYINAYILVNHLGAERFEIAGWVKRPREFVLPWEKHTYSGHEANPIFRLHRRHLERPQFLRGL